MPLTMRIVGLAVGAVIAGGTMISSLPAHGRATAGTPGGGADIPFEAQQALVPSTHTSDAIRRGTAEIRRPSRRPDGTTDWRAVIDSTWGAGMPTHGKSQLFETAWSTISYGFACFHDIVVPWDSLHTAYGAEIAGGVSRGRFAGIMNHLTRALRESHTHVSDLGVNGSALDPGVPLLVRGGWGFNTHFGAGLTPLPDRSLLVYKSIPAHPLGLVPGDRVLGYDGRPWNELYRELIAAELPLTGWWHGSSPSSYEHSWLMSAGMNWHLFETIDIVKQATGDTLHLATGPLLQATTPLWCTEQLDIPGVPKPGYPAQQDEVFSWGIVEGTTIGYIYGWGWFGNAEADFRAAVEALHDNTTGLIIDFRTNYGGNMFLSNDALSLLFPVPTETIGFSQRCNVLDRLPLCPSPNSPPEVYIIPGSAATAYNKPIAVLTGPGAVSSGDQVALRFKYHPRARIFGKSTSTAFNAPMTMNLGAGPDWGGRYARVDAYEVSNPTQHLTHRELEVDEEVWLRPEDVAEGRDTVVEAAIAWIERQTPIAVHDLQAHVLTDGVQLTWSVTADEAVHTVHVLRRDVERDREVQLATLAGDVRTYLDSSAEPAGHYEYALGVVGADGIETRSAATTVAIPALSLALHANVPNPFNPTTTLRYDLPEPAQVVLRVHDVRGRTIRTLVEGRVAAGRQRVVWDGDDDAGRSVGSGFYLARLEAAGTVRQQKMLLLR